MILEPWKDQEEIDRRLSALEDPELAELLRTANRDLFGDEHPESYTSPAAPYWKARIGYIALAGLLSLTAGFSATFSMRHPGTRVVPAAPVPAHRHAALGAVPAKRSHHVAIAPKHHPTIYRAAVAAAPSEVLIRQARAQLLHEQALATQAQAEAVQAQHRAQIAVRAREAAQARAHAEAVAQAQEEALAQARAEALAQARAEALAQERAQAQAEAEAQAQAQAQAQAAQAQAAPDIDVKPGAGPPPTYGHISVYPVGGVPVPVPPPYDKNCTPSRGGIFRGALDHVRVGGTNVGGLLRLIHP